MERTRDVIGRFTHYVEKCSLAAFLERYVREEPLYHKPGPAHRLAENPFDSRVIGGSPSTFVTTNAS
jgi:hypothetical protein